MAPPSASRSARAAYALVIPGAVRAVFLFQSQRRLEPGRAHRASSTPSSSSTRFRSTPITRSPATRRYIDGHYYSEKAPAMVVVGAAGVRADRVDPAAARRGSGFAARHGASPSGSRLRRRRAARGARRRRVLRAPARAIRSAHRGDRHVRFVPRLVDLAVRDVAVRARRHDRPAVRSRCGPRSASPRLVATTSPASPPASRWRRSIPASFRARSSACISDYTEPAGACGDSASARFPPRC